MALLRHVYHWLHRLADPPLFVVAFGPGGASTARGPVSDRALAGCAALAAEFGITRGHVDGVRRAGTLLLRFSPGIPPASHQRFRNVLGNPP